MRCHLEPDRGPLQRGAGAVEIDLLAMEVTQPLLGAVARSFSARPIDLAGVLSDVSQHGHLIVAYFHVPAEDRQITPLLAFAVHEFTLPQLGEQRGMTRE